MVEHNGEIEAMLVESINKAREINPDKTTNPAQTLDEYYDFIDWASRAMPWAILPTGTYSTLYEQTYQALTYFYFINDQPLSQLENKGYYNNSLQYHEPYRTWLVNFVKQYGTFLSTSESWNNQIYQKVLKDDSFGLQKGWYEAPSNWSSFNDFFSRRLRSADMRPISSPKNQSVVVSPADSKAQGVWSIDGDSYLRQKDGVVIKSARLTSIAKLIGKDSAYKDAFAGGTLTHAYLDVNDYHRCHFPVDGTVKEVRIIKGDASVGGFVKWDAKSKKYLYDASELGWQTIQTRGCVIVETDNFGLVAILLIGDAQTSSVVFEDGVEQGKTFKKGDMLGHFLFGGSNVVMIFQKHVDFRLTVPSGGKGSYKHLLVGEEYGRLSKK
jgi:phosphatidylserine decarboxylase precursor